MIKSIAILLTLLAAGIFSSCNNTTTPANTSSSLPSQPNTMIFTVSGSTTATDTLTDYGADTTLYGIKGTGVIGAGASTSRLSGFGLGIVLGNVTSTGTYNIGAPTPSNPLTDVYVYYTALDTSGNKLSYQSPQVPNLLPSQAVGSITIDTLGTTSGSTVAGTFNGTLTLQNGNSTQKTVTITNGAFRATIL